MWAEGTRLVRLVAVLAATVLTAAPTVAGCTADTDQPSGSRAERPTEQAASSPPVPAQQSDPAEAQPSGEPGQTGPPDGTPSECRTARALASWPVRRLVAQTVVVPVDEHDVGSVASQVAAGAGGVILFGSEAPNDLGPQLARLKRRARGGIPPLVMADEEGGAVQRMANLAGAMPSARVMGATMTPRQIRRLARRVGARMAAAGVTMNLAPVLDLDAAPGPSDANPVGTRSFSPRWRRATADGLAFAAGMRRVGVVPVVKHFPGLGGATGNTDVRPASTKPWRELRRSGLLPFQAAVSAGVPAVMVANARVPGLTGLPASLSRRVVHGVLRRQLGFSGLVLTDSLSAVAISAAGYDVPAAAVRALSAGADMVLYGAGSSTVAELTDRTVGAIARAVRSGDLSRERLRSAVAHILEAKGVDPCDLPLRTP